MKLILKIARTELQMLFYTPIAWSILMIFAFQTGMTFSGQVATYVKEYTLWQEVSYVTSGIFGRVFYESLEYLYLYVPLLAMGLISRDQHSGVIRLLSSSPITNLHIVLGKYLAMSVFGLALSGILLIYAILGCIIIENPDIPLMLTGILGVFLLFCTYAAIGLFMSAVSSYQVVAAIGTLLILSALNFVGSVWQDIAFVRDITFWLCLRNRAAEFVSGLICSEDVIYFLMIPAMFIGFTVLKLNFTILQATFLQKITRYAGVFLITVFIGYLSARPALMGYIDMTREKGNTLSKASQEIMKNLQGKVTITSYVNLLDENSSHALPNRANSDRYGFRRYLRFKPDMQLKYVYYYDSIQPMPMLALHNPELDLKQVARRMGSFQRLRFHQFLSPEQIRKKIDLSDEGNRFVRIIECENGKKGYLRFFNDLQRSPSEAEISASLKRLVMDLPVVGFLTGHGERNIYQLGERGYNSFTNDRYFRAALVNQGFNFEEVSLQKEIPEHIHILVIADMRDTLDRIEHKNLQRYIDKGGNLLLAGEAGKERLWNPLLSYFGAAFLPGTLVQPTGDSQPQLIRCFPTDEAAEWSHYLKQMKGWRQEAIMNGATAIRFQPANGFTAIPILRCDSVWNEMQTTDYIDNIPSLDTLTGEQPGSHITMMALSRPRNGKTQKVILLGDADCISNGELFRQRKSERESNYYIIVSSFFYLSDGIAPIDTRLAEPTDRHIYVAKRGTQIVNIVFRGIFPALLALIALFIWIRRRSR